MRNHSRKYVEWAAAGISAAMLFFFFFWVLPFHLFHREQTQLFLLTWEAAASYLHPGALAELSGDFLTQFFYYTGGGPAIMTVVLLLWGAVIYRLLFPYMGYWAWVPTVLAVIWESGRQCGLIYPLSGTIALTGIGCTLVSFRKCVSSSGKRRWPIGIVVLLAGYALFGCGNWSGKGYNVPNLQREQLLALDSEIYFGRQEDAMKRLEKHAFRSPITSYYYNLLNARQGQLPDRLMAYYQPATLGLFPPVDPSSDYFRIYATNEVWFELGDMTMAEHSAILGMIFSPHHTGARAVKRLAEINLINGDEAAAMKYLRMLQHTLCYREWAERRIPGRQTPEVRQWLERKRKLVVTADTLRSSTNVPLSLRHLLRSHPANRMALDYLLCFDLLSKDITSFGTDYEKFVSDRIPSRLYDEALLIYLAQKQASLEDVKKYQIPVQVVDEFNDYSKTYQANNGNGMPLQDKYGKTYWFYYHYATMVSKKNE